VADGRRSFEKIRAFTEAAKESVRRSSFFVPR